MMVREDFKKWLIEVRYCSKCTANDLVARCNSVERLFNVDLSDVIRNPADCEKM